MIKNIVFDFGGVVIDWNPHYAYDPYFGDRAKSDWFLANICTWAWNNSQDAGRPFAEAVASLSAEYPEWSAEIALVPDECLFIDDSKKNTDAAEGVGMHSVLFVDAGRLESDLKALGLDF